MSAWARCPSPWTRPTSGGTRPAAPTRRPTGWRCACCTTSCSTWGRSPWTGPAPPRCPTRRTGRRGSRRLCCGTTGPPCGNRSGRSGGPTPRTWRGTGARCSRGGSARRRARGTAGVGGCFPSLAGQEGPRGNRHRGRAVQRSTPAGLTTEHVPKALADLDAGAGSRGGADGAEAAAGAAMSDAVKAQVGRMMRWQSRALAPVPVLHALAIAQFPAGEWLDASPALRLLFLGAALGALPAAVVLGAITLWHIFQAGRMAFGVRAGLIYAFLAVALLFWPGLFAIPHMVRLDVKRLLGGEPEDAEQARA